MTQMPLATGWLLASVGAAQEPVIRSVYLVWSKKTSMKGTCFALSTGYLVTNDHVVKDSGPDDLVVISSSGEACNVKSLATHAEFDLAVLTMDPPRKEGFRIQTAAPGIGTLVRTWGYPLAYNGPSPILTTGYLAGFNAVRNTPTGRVLKNYVVNGAFNPGNSGGPLVGDTGDAVIGVVVSKHAPISDWHLSALEALKNQKSGFQYSATDGEGNTHTFSEGQLVGDLLQYFREMTQVVIGEAIAADELVAFLKVSGASWVEV